MNRVFIGYDERQPIAWNVCAQSVMDRASGPVSIIRLDLKGLPITRRGLTAFTYSRFLVPWLCDYEGRALFLDSDILVRGDVIDLFDEDFGKDAGSSVALVQGPMRFEWSSVMYFDCGACVKLSPEYIENPENKLLDLAWAKIHPLPKEWNHLVGYDAPNPDAKIVHFTKGIPVWPETGNCEFAYEWVETYKRMNFTVSYQELMGRSVHAQQRVG